MVVDDDQDLAEMLGIVLTGAGIDVDLVSRGDEVLEVFRNNPPDLVLLDVMLPGLDGIQLCKEIRGFSDVPILMLTARIDELDRLLGLDTGADDYVCKPFAPREVIARIRALLRRSEGKVKTNIKPWVIDEPSSRISWNGEWLPLTRIEFMMLRLLLSRPGRVFSRNHLLNSIHESQKDISDRAIDTHIKNLRKKLQTLDSQNECISSVYGLGYRFDYP